MNDATRSRRISAIRDALFRERADWLLLPPSADFRWLTGAVARSTERLVALVIPGRGDPFCVVPRLEAGSLANECPWLDLEVWDEHEDPFQRLEQRMSLATKPIVLLGEGLRVSPLLRLAASSRLRPAAAVLAPLRAIKDADELAALDQAAGHADRVVEEVADLLEPGLTERQVARLAIERFESLGDTEPWAICASGPHAALPHHQSSDRRLRDGEAVLLDVGAFTHGYGSDITRVYWLGAMPEEAVRIYEIVDQAREAGISAVREGAIPEEVDRAARALIERAGYGEHFIHRLGHGVGLEIHEPPYLARGSREPLASGMVHSVEPGIYLPGRFGIRLEDLVVVEERGARRLNRAPRHPQPPRLRARTHA